MDKHSDKPDMIRYPKSGGAIIEYWCSECNSAHLGKELMDPTDLHQMLNPGDPYPAGECPDCGCFVSATKQAHDALIFSNDDGPKTLSDRRRAELLYDSVKRFALCHHDEMGIKAIEASFEGLIYSLKNGYSRTVTGPSDGA